MRQKQFLSFVTFGLGAVSLLCLAAYFLALHDISKDYASPETWHRQGLDLPAWLPEWAACPGEWQIVRFGFWPILGFHLLFFVSFFRKP